MSKRAEEAALKAYPEKMGMFHEADIHYEADLNKAARIKYTEGYDQAEKETIERACGWLESLQDGDRIVDVKALVSAFRNEMEEE